MAGLASPTTIIDQINRLLQADLAFVNLILDSSFQGQVIRDDQTVINQTKALQSYSLNTVLLGPIYDTNQFILFLTKAKAEIDGHLARLKADGTIATGVNLNPKNAKSNTTILNKVIYGREAISSFESQNVYLSGIINAATTYLNQQNAASNAPKKQPPVQPVPVKVTPIPIATLPKKPPVINAKSDPAIKSPVQKYYKD